MSNVIADTYTTTGLVATTPRHLVTTDGLAITSFRLAASGYRLNRATGKMDDSQTNWFTVTTFGQLAITTASSIHKGERIIVTGGLRVRDWDNGERAGTSVEIEADTLAHDLSWGTSVFTRTVLVKSGDPVRIPSGVDLTTSEE